MTHQCLPVTLNEAQNMGFEALDFVFVSGDAYVDHPSFGAALLARVLLAEGHKVGILPQPNLADEKTFFNLGTPKYGFFVSGGVVDSMVAHYTVAKRRRQFDEYSPGGKIGLRPDYAVSAYTKKLKELFPDTPVVIGGIEASLRRFAHYDYWSDDVLPSILESGGADLLSFGMGERSLKEIAARLAAGEDIKTIQDVKGTAYLCDFMNLPAKYRECASYHKVKTDKIAYAKATRIQHDEQDPLSALPLVQKQSGQYLVQNIPALPLEREELDAIYALPFTRKPHPQYQKDIPALEEVLFSLAHNRGCFGGCHFCAITLHQGRRVTSRSKESVLCEAKRFMDMPEFKGYIHDVGGPTANFRVPSCQKQQKYGVCKGDKHCLAPSPCSQLEVDHSEYLSLLQSLRALPGVKRVFVRSGIRFDYLLQDKSEQFLEELVAHHVSGQLKVAPEHCAPNTLRAMGKPSIATYERFAKRFYALSQKAKKEQYLVPYLMSSHPGCTLQDAVTLALWLKKNKIRPEQVQDFYPTPGTISTAMYHTGLDPYTLKPLYVAKTAEEKAMQRSLLQTHLPKQRLLAKKALLKAGRADLVAIFMPGERVPVGKNGEGSAKKRPSDAAAQKSKKTIRGGRGKNEKPERGGCKEGKLAKQRHPHTKSKGKAR